MNWLNVLFSITDGAFTQAQMEALRATQASWVVLNRRLGRMFIDIIGPTAQLVAIRDKLVALGRDPIVLGVFDKDGTLITDTYPANKVEWLNVARDVSTYNPDGSILSTVRPTAYVDVHRWAGWGEKVIP